MRLPVLMILAGCASPAPVDTESKRPVPAPWRVGLVDRMPVGVSVWQVEPHAEVGTFVYANAAAQNMVPALDEAEPGATWFEVFPSMATDAGELYWHVTLLSVRNDVPIRAGLTEYGGVTWHSTNVPDGHGYVGVVFQPVTDPAEFDRGGLDFAYSTPLATRVEFIDQLTERVGETLEGAP